LSRYITALVPLLHVLTTSCSRKGAAEANREEGGRSKGGRGVRSKGGRGGRSKGGKGEVDAREEGEVDAREEGEVDAREEGEVEVKVPPNEQATKAATNKYQMIAAGYESTPIMSFSAAAAAAATPVVIAAPGLSGAIPTTAQQLHYTHHATLQHQLPSALSVGDSEYAQGLRLSRNIADGACGTN
jgi:hypothetical protein